MDKNLEPFVKFYLDHKGEKSANRVELLLNTEISLYRLYAYKNPYTNVAKICHRYANQIENSMKGKFHD